MGFPNKLHSRCCRRNTKRSIPIASWRNTTRHEARNSLHSKNERIFTRTGWMTKDKYLRRPCARNSNNKETTTRWRSTSTSRRSDDTFQIFQSVLVEIHPSPNVECLISLERDLRHVYFALIRYRT